MFQLHRGIAALILVASVFGLAGCVSDDEYQQLLNEKAAADRQAVVLTNEKFALKVKLEKEEQKSADLQAKLGAANEKNGMLMAQKQAERQAKLAARGQAHLAQQREDAASKAAGKTAAAAVNQAAKIKATASTGKKTG